MCASKINLISTSFPLVLRHHRLRIEKCNKTIQTNPYEYNYLGNGGFHLKCAFMKTSRRYNTFLQFSFVMEKCLLFVYKINHVLLSRPTSHIDTLI